MRRTWLWSCRALVNAANHWSTALESVSGAACGPPFLALVVLCCSAASPPTSREATSASHMSATRAPSRGACSLTASVNPLSWNARATPTASAIVRRWGAAARPRAQELRA